MVVLNFLYKLFDYRHQFKIGESIMHYKIVEKIGEGRFGIVYLCRDTTNNIVVIKQLKREMLIKQPQKIYFEKDILTSLSPLNDERFPLLIDTINLKYRKGYILEYKEGKTFEDIIYKDHYCFTRNEIYNIAYQLLDIIKVLNNHNIVHKDIRVSNVIMHHTGKLFLIDFGLARYLDDDAYTPDLDFWYFGDFLIHLFYTQYNKDSSRNIPWYDELELFPNERLFLLRLMSIDPVKYPLFKSTDEIKAILDSLRYT